MKCEFCDRPIFCKGLCRPHYRKIHEYTPETQAKYRKTEQGRKLAKNWNDSAEGKAAVARYQRRPKARFSFGKSRAKRSGLRWTLSLEEFSEFLLKPCFYCAGPINCTGVGLDRLDSEMGYEVENVVPCCRSCNVIKSDLITWQEMLEVAKLLKTLRNK